MARSRLVAVASGGGHLVQLQMMSKSFEAFDVLYITTARELAGSINGRAQVVPDCNRNRPIAMAKTFIATWKILTQERPDIVLSTGALPGAIAIILARFMGAQTIWLDSIANAKRLSLSARIVRPFCSLVLTQWPNLASSRKVNYLGALL